MGIVRGGHDEMIVAEFVGRPTSGMRYYDATRDSRDTILDHYTGVGEVLAIYDPYLGVTMIQYTAKLPLFV